MLAGVVFTATRVDLTKLTNELQFRGDAHASLSTVLHEPAVTRALRCGPLTVPNHKLVPDARWILDLPRDRVLARADPNGPRPLARRRALRHEPLRDLPPRVHEPRRPDLDPGPAAGLAADRDERLRRRLCPLLTGGAGPGPPPSPRSCSAALALRLCGLRHGLPFVYNADENAHFVAGRDRDVRAHLQPELLHQPAGLHVPAARRVPGRLRRARRRLGGLRDRPRRRLRGRAGAVGRARRGRRRAAGVGGRAAVRPPRRLRRRRAAGGRLPARPLRPPRAQRRPDARAAVPRARRRRRRLRPRAPARLRARRRRPRARLRDEVHGRDRAAAAAGGGRRRPRPGVSARRGRRARARGRAGAGASS